MSDQWLQNLNELSKKYTELLGLLSRHNFTSEVTPNLDYNLMQEISNAWIDLCCNHRGEVQNTNQEYYSNLSNLLSSTMQKFTEESSDKSTDRRFKDNSWRENVFFNFVKEYYLLSSNWTQDNIKNLNISEEAKDYLEFNTEQFLNAASPSNMPFLNPQVIQESIKSNGGSLLNGIDNLIADLKKSNNILNISTTDEGAFQVGENIAHTKGKVVYQNDLMQLICYEPKKKTFATPILIIPPWINKYYILDLSEHNSFVKWLVDNNFQVFMVSWVNPDEKLTHKTFDNYLQEGVLESIDYICSKFNYKQVNLLGYCIGGTLLSSALGYLKAKKDNRINSATLLTSLLNFSEPGNIKFFINKKNYDSIENMMDKAGMFEGSYMNNVFKILRSNEMIWSYFVNNYLLGKNPKAFDILYWNSDYTNLPAAMNKFYLKNMYIENNLMKEGGINLLDTSINLNKIDNPMFVLATQTDHIVPWHSAFESAKLLSGPIEFCLAASGHVAGVINPPNKNKYSYWVGDDFNSKMSADKWQKKAKEVSGSWWNHWYVWQEKLSGSMTKSIDYNNIKDFIELAPGSYVKKRY